MPQVIQEEDRPSSWIQRDCLTNALYKELWHKTKVVDVRSVFKVALELKAKEHTSVWRESGKVSWSKWRLKWALKCSDFTPPDLCAFCSLWVYLFSLVHLEDLLEMWLMHHFSFRAFPEPSPYCPQKELDVPSSLLPKALLCPSLSIHHTDFFFQFWSNYLHSLNLRQFKSIKEKSWYSCC